MKTVFSFFATILFSTSAFTQTSSSSEVMCRGQAKEIAMQTYTSCITTARATQVEEIRKNYQKELADLKNKYDHELKRMNGGAVSTAAPKKNVKAQPVVAAKPLKGAKPVKGIAKELPVKNSESASTLPVQTVSEGTKVVAVTPAITPETSSNSMSSSYDAVESEAAEADQVEIIDMPTE